MKEILLTGPYRQSDDQLLLDYREIGICKNATVRLATGFAPKKVHLEHHALLPEHHVSFNFCLKGSQRFTLTGNYTPTEADPRQCNVLLLPDEQFSTSMDVSGEFSTATFFISLSKYLDILGESVEILPKNFLIAAERRNLCYFKNHDWHPRIRQIIVQILTEQFSPLAGRIFLESKMLELIAVLLELDHRASENQCFIPKRDEEKIRYAREVLEQNIVDPPSLASLARIAGTNEFALKKGFKQVFGVPVFQFLQKLRMAKAVELLHTGEHQVSEVALAVGYDNLSAFTRAFRQVHGMPPSEWCKTPFRHK
jgi:AraC-like DNA-binding protein